MKDIVIHLRVEKYIKQWLEHSFGNPVRFPARSYENLLLSRLLQRRPSTATPAILLDSDEVAIVIPDNDLKRPEFYNFLGRRGIQAMVTAIDGLFRLALWSDCAALVGAELNRGIDDWCFHHGIELDAREAVRQKFYRMRKAYRIHGIIIGKTYSKTKNKFFSENHCHDTGKF